MFDKDYTVFGPFLHGPGWTGGYTPWVLTMEAGHIGKGGPWLLTYPFGTDSDNLTGQGAVGEIVLVFAGYYTGHATNALLLILEEVVFAHIRSCLYLSISRP